MDNLVIDDIMSPFAITFDILKVNQNKMILLRYYRYTSAVICSYKPNSSSVDRPYPKPL